jgi:hypothetical protein
VVRRAVVLWVLGVALVLAPLSPAAPAAGGTFLVAEPGANIDSIDESLGGVAGTVPPLRDGVREPHASLRQAVA